MITVFFKADREYALCKTWDDQRARTVFELCKLHLGQLYPGATLSISKLIKDWDRLEMHPEKESILNRLREMEFPLPSSDLEIETQWERELA